MTKLMEQAIQKLRSVPEEKQDSVAGFVLSELEGESSSSGEEPLLRPVLTPVKSRRSAATDPRSRHGPGEFLSDVTGSAA